MKIRQAAVEEVLVTIPRGGLGTYKLTKGIVETLLRESPSHPVGLEPQITTLTKIRHNQS
jgi:hypothetical protein